MSSSRPSEIRGQTEAGVVEVEMYMCIANKKIVLKCNLVDRVSFPCVKC